MLSADLPVAPFRIQDDYFCAKQTLGYPVHVILDWISETANHFTQVIKTKHNLRKRPAINIQSIVENKTLRKFTPFLFEEWMENTEIMRRGTPKRMNLLQKFLVFCSLDEAANNYGIICKKTLYYVSNERNGSDSDW